MPPVKKKKILPNKSTQQLENQNQRLQVQLSQLLQENNLLKDNIERERERAKSVYAE